MDNQAGARQPYRIVTPPSAATMACKRAFDILCSFLGLTVLSPVLLVVSLFTGALTGFVTALLLRATRHINFTI